MIERMFDRGYEPIPTILGDLEPGAELGGILACIDVTEVSPHDRITVLQAHQRQRSYYDAHMYRDMAAVVDVMDDTNPQWAAESAAAEIRAALRLTRRATDTELSFALELRERLPRVWDALVAGNIDIRRAKTFSYATTHLSDATTRRVVDRVIDAAGQLTTGELKARLDRIAIEADPDGAQQRYEEAVKDRRLVVEPTTSGTANLMGFELPPHRVSAVSRRINHLARSLNTKDDPRSMDQLRADVYLDLLTGNADSSAGGVHIQTDLDTLVGLAEHPGELAGYGPVIADIARKVAAEQDNAQWRWTVTDPATGQALHNGTTGRRPTTSQRRTVEARNQTCIFPGCRMPAIDCDLDHTTRWADGGETTIDNLTPLCRHDHRIRHQAGWTHQPLPNGDHQWTTKLGHTYTTSGQPP